MSSFSVLRVFIAIALAFCAMVAMLIMWTVLATDADGQEPDAGGRPASSPPADDWSAVEDLPPAVAAPGGASWTYEGLDGRPITVVDTDSTSFTGGLPEPVVAIDRAIATGDCMRVLEQLDLWVGYMNDPTWEGSDLEQRSEAYVSYGWDRSMEIGCNFAG